MNEFFSKLFRSLCCGVWLLLCRNKIVLEKLLYMCAKLKIAMLKNGRKICPFSKMAILHFGQYIYHTMVHCAIFYVPLLTTYNNVQQDGKKCQQSNFKIKQIKLQSLYMHRSNFSKKAYKKAFNYILQSIEQKPIEIYNRYNIFHVTMKMQTIGNVVHQKVCNKNEWGLTIGHDTSIHIK